MKQYKINTPAEYEQAWQDYQRICAQDISPRLLGTVYTPEDSVDQSYLYPKGFYYAWGFSNTSLALLLELNYLYGQKDVTKVSVGLAEVVGFTGLESFGGGHLAVYTLPESQQIQVLVPTVQTWMRILDDLGFGVPLDVSIAITQSYASLGCSQDVVDIYNTLSGLDRTILLDPERGYAPTDPAVQSAWLPFNIHTPQQQMYQEIMVILGRSPYNFNSSEDVSEVGEVTLKLFDNLSKILAAANTNGEILPKVMAVRAALAQGQDASALNTLVGLGYNTYPNPFVCKPLVVQTIQQRYTSREFILLNRQLADCQAFVSLPLPADNKNRPYLVDGWC